jgi:P4 family phage/plasmid primase-like protien
MPRYDLDLVKSAADGRWKDILASLGNVDSHILDGQHHACPKQCHPDAGGKDRFRALDDFDQVGGVFCNQCFSTKNRSGFDALQWLTGEDFKTVLAKVAKYLGVSSIKGRKKSNPADHLEFLPWNPTLVGLWCLTKKPIARDAVQRLGAKVAKYRKQYTVIAIPVWGPALDQEDAVGWVLYRADGGLLPKYEKKDEPPKWVKVKLALGSQQGLIVDLAKWKDNTARRWWKVEGTPDLAAAESQTWPEDDGFFTTANGAQEKPQDWIVERLRNLPVNVVHDCDKPGQLGATWVEQEGTGRRRAGWCPVLAESCSEVRNIVLPFPIEPHHGPDLRDFLSGGATCKDMIELADNSPIWAREQAAEEAASEWIDKAEDDPSLIAEVNLRKYRDAGRNLVQWRGEWFQFKRTRYESINRVDLKIRMRKSIQDEFERQWHASKKDKPARKVTSLLVNEVIEATASQSYVDREVEIGSWVEERGSKWDMQSDGPKNCVALKNGILCLDRLFAGAPESEFLIPHTSNWFSTICLPYDFNSESKCESWLKFLEDAFSGDVEAIECLQKWMGYLLVHDMSLEKILFVIGKKRSGKGTIMKTIIELLGRSSVASPSLNAFAGQYMLHSLVGKSAVVIPDVRLSRRADNIVITERLLSISGCDPQDIERKYLDTLNGVQMQCRFTLFSNMLPYLEDHSAAFVSRCIFLSMPNSYYGREDLGLFDRIKSEMSGILNWAIMGQYQLRERKVIDQPESGKHLQRQMQTMAAPVSQFLLDRVAITDNADHSVGVHELFELYCEWCSENDRVRKMDQEHFRRSIRDVHPNAMIKTVTYAGTRHSRIFGMLTKEEELV